MRRDRPDGRISVCPICAIRTSTGSLRAHVAGDRCLATALREKVSLTPEQRALVDMVEAFDNEVRRMAAAAELAPRAKQEEASHAS